MYRNLFGIATLALALTFSAPAHAAPSATASKGEPEIKKESVKVEAGWGGYRSGWGGGYRHGWGGGYRPSWGGGYRPYYGGYRPYYGGHHYHGGHHHYPHHSWR